MSPQLLWTIAGLILTTLTLGSVSISAFQSTDSAQAKLAAAELGNISVAARLWAANGGDVASATTASLSKYVPSLAYDSGGDVFESKAIPGHIIYVAPPQDADVCGAGRKVLQIGIEGESTDAWAKYRSALLPGMVSQSCNANANEDGPNGKSGVPLGGSIYIAL